MFQLSFPITESPNKISLADSLILMGSCFADNVGDKLKAFKFNISSNPFGTIYNPLSLSQLLMDQVDPAAVVEQKGIYYHWQAHGEVSSLSQLGLDKLVDERRSLFQSKLKNADWLIVTLGSAFAYRLNVSGQIVANCHKVPQTNFSKELLSVVEMTDHLELAFNRLQNVNPKLKIILTVSPVRHVRDGLIENNLSKARLIEVAHSLSKRDDISYFPAYEILIDELRDYRFYAKDRLHPSEEAVDYIWTRFSETYFDEDTKSFIKHWQSLQSALNHRPFHPSSPEHQTFIRATINKLNALSSLVDVSSEVSLLERQLV